MEKPLGLDRISVKNSRAWRKAFEAKNHDDGFQGWKPGAHEETWEAMSSKERRSAWVWDLIIGFGGALILWKVL